jgi:glutathione S-transferase
MNFARDVRAIDVSDGVRKDVARIEQIWSQCLEASGGPFLFGEFSNADAMYAPVVNRLEIYALSDHPAVKAYTAAMKALARVGRMGRCRQGRAVDLPLRMRR